MHGTAATCLRVAVPGAVGAVWATTPIGGANLTMTAGRAGPHGNHGERRAITVTPAQARLGNWGCPSPQNQPPGSSREGKPDKLARGPLNPRGGSGERIDQAVCAGDGQRRYWVLSARGGWRGDDPGPGRGGHADP